jgi:hypothetical protein
MAISLEGGMVDERWVGEAKDEWRVLGPLISRVKISSCRFGEVGFSGRSQESVRESHLETPVKV